MQKISVRVKYNGFESIHIHPRRTQNDVYRRFCYAFFFSPCCSGTFICVFIEQPINFENKKLYIFFASPATFFQSKLELSATAMNIRTISVCMLKNREAENE